MSHILKAATAAFMALIVTIAPASILAAEAGDGDDHSYLPPSMRSSLPGQQPSQPTQLANVGTDQTAPQATKERRTKTEHDGGFFSRIFGQRFHFAWDR
jgi:hypothetical protein